MLEPASFAQCPQKTEALEYGLSQGGALLISIHERAHTAGRIGGNGRGEAPGQGLSDCAPVGRERGGGKERESQGQPTGPRTKKDIQIYKDKKRYIRVFENLRDNRLGPEGGTAVAAGLHRLTGLTKLEVRCA